MTMVQLKVVAVSSNLNSFGLRNMVFVGNNGQGWEAAANELNVKEKGDVLTIPEGQSITTFLVSQSFELVRHLTPSPPPEVMEEVWGKS